MSEVLHTPSLAYSLKQGFSLNRKLADSATQLPVSAPALGSQAFTAMLSEGWGSSQEHSSPQTALFCGDKVSRSPDWFTSFAPTS